MTPISRIVRATDWKYAFGEVLLIVIGISIALAIDKWRENVRDIRTEHEYIEQLVSDLKSTEELLAAAVEGTERSVSAGSQLLAIFEGGESVDPDHIRQLISEFWYYDNPVPVLATAEALVATGDLRLIRNPAVRSAITRYVSRSRDYWLPPLYSSESKYDEYIFRLWELAAKHGILSSRSGVAGQFHEKSNVEAFVASTEAYAATRILLELHDFFRVFCENIGLEAAALRQVVEPRLEAE